MAYPKLTSVLRLRNHGLEIVHTSSRAVTRRFERPNGTVSTHEAAMYLKTYPNMVRRMIRAGRIEVARGRGVRRIVVRGLVRVGRAGGVSARRAGS